jgi:hypothetical protein
VWVSKPILDELSQTRVQFFYLDRQATMLYNSQLEVNSPLAFCGWCWYRGGEEYGPFKSLSAARINAYYTLCLRQRPPQHYMSNRKQELRLKVIGG